MLLLVLLYAFRHVEEPPGLLKRCFYTTVRFGIVSYYTLFLLVVLMLCSYLICFNYHEWCKY